MNKSILFVVPDYHCSFIYRDALRDRGWRADVYVPKGYPKKLLYSDRDIVILKDMPRIFKRFYDFFILMSWFFKYNYFFIYGDTSLIALLPVSVERRMGKGFYLDLFLAKLFKKKFVYFPSGCLDTDLKSNIAKYDNGNICNNCGWGSEVCNDKKNKTKFEKINKYFDINLSYHDFDSTQFVQQHIKYKSLNLNLWNPDISIPDRFRLPKTKNLRILHSFFELNREADDKNIKGSPYILAAIEKLRKEGYNVEYYYVNDVDSKNMRYYQAQADIVVEQLIIGWWGSTGIEAMSLGKPVICYLRRDAKENFFKHFSEYNSLPIIEANIFNIYEVLKKTVEDKDFREQKALESRKFAESFFDINKNVLEFEKLLLEYGR